MKLSLIIGSAFLLIGAVLFLAAPIIPLFADMPPSTPKYPISSLYEDFQPNGMEEESHESWLMFSPPLMLDYPILEIETRNVLVGTLLMVSGAFIARGKAELAPRSSSKSRVIVVQPSGLH